MSLSGVYNAPLDLRTAKGLQLACLGLIPHRTKTIKAEGVAIAAAGQATTVATLTGSGTIKQIWFTAAEPTLGWYCDLQGFWDGEVSPSLDCEIGQLFFADGGGTDLSRDMWTENWRGSYGYGGQVMGVLKYPMPYSNGAVIKVARPASGVTSSSFFMIVEYTPDITSPLRLKSAQPYRYLTPHIMAYDEEVDFLSLAAGNRGYIVWHGLHGEGVNGNTWQERNYRLIENVGTQAIAAPTYESSGTEDFFNGAYYFKSDVWNGHTPPKSWPDAVFGYRNTVAADFDGWTSYYGKDLLAANGGYRFVNGTQMRWMADGGIAGHGVNMRHTTLYYVGA